MHTGKTQIRFALLFVTLIALGTSLVSLSYLNQMTKAIDRIAYEDARTLQLGESISRQILEARREEKNFIIYLDSLYLNNSLSLVIDLEQQIHDYRASSERTLTELDTIVKLLNRYENRVMEMSKMYTKNPHRFNRLQSNLLEYEKSAGNLALPGWVAKEEIIEWMSDSNPLVSTGHTIPLEEKVHHFVELKTLSDAIVQVSQNMVEQAKNTLETHTTEGTRYSIVAQRNTLALIFASGFLLIVLIVWMPRRIFNPYNSFIKSLRLLSLGGRSPAITHFSGQNNEIGELSRAIEKAMHETQNLSALKSAKIQSIQRMYRRLMDEVDDAVIILDRDFNILVMNNQALSWLNMDDRNPVKLSDIPDVWDAVHPTLLNIQRAGRTELSFTSKALNLKKKQMILVPLLREGPALDYVVMVIKR